MQRDLTRQLRGVNADVTSKVRPEVDRAAAARAEADIRALGQRLGKARDVEADAIGKVRVAELRLAEMRDTGKAKASQLAAAEERLNAATRDLAGAQQNTARLTEQLSTAHQRTATAADTAQRSTRGLLSSVHGLRSAMGTAFGTGAGLLGAQLFTTGLAKVKDFVGGSVEAFSSLNESVNAVNKIFGAQSSAIIAWGEKNANAIGLSRRAFQELATPLGAGLKNAGLSMEDVTKNTIALTERAADMASVFNTTVPEALEAIQAGLRGESDPLERFGVGLSEAQVNAKALSMGLVKGSVDLAKVEQANIKVTKAQAAFNAAVKEHGRDSLAAREASNNLQLAQDGLEKATAGSTGEMTNQQKALARVALIMEQTQSTAGDFRQTSDGLANAQRIEAARTEELKAQIGEKLAPAMLKLTAIKLKLANVVSADLLPALDRVGGWMSTHTTTVRVMAGIIGGLLVVGFLAWAAAAASAAVATIAATWPVIVITGAIAALAAGFVYAYTHSETFRVGVQTTFQALHWYVTKVVAPVVLWLWHEVVVPAFQGSGIIVSSVWDHVIRPTFNALKNGISTVADSFRTAVDTIGRVWDGLQAAAAKPVNFVIGTVYNNGIRSVWNSIAGLVGLPKLPELGLISFGPAGPSFAGGNMRLAEGGMMPGYTPGRDVHTFVSPTGGVLQLSGGEPVLRPEVGRVLGASWVDGVNAAARSGGVGGVQRYLGGFAAGGLLPRIADSAAGLFANPAGTLRRMFGDPAAKVRAALGDSAWADMLAQVPTRLVSAAVDFLAAQVGGLFGGGGAAPGGGVARWSDTVLQALSMLGQPATLLNTVLRRMQRESGGNPSVVNRWDSNWLRGTPSVGLMQVIGPTFSRYAGPLAARGPFLYGVSTDPLANTYAGLNYALHRYPSLAFAMDKPGGYDSGGWLPPGWSTVYNGTGRPEPVLSDAQWRAVARGLGGQLDGARITGTLDLGGGLTGYVDGRIEAANQRTGTAISQRRRM